MGTTRRLQIGILTSSRADYGIYLPLLRQLTKDGRHDISIVAFGTHLSKKHGYTIDEILKDGFEVPYRFETAPIEDTPEAIVTSMALTMQKFASFWREHATSFDVVFCLGDRYEMFAAVASTVPFNIRLAHLHGGETTLGAVDNAFRHSITQFCKIHFTATDLYAKRVIELLDDNSNIYNVGALGLDNFHLISFLSEDELKKQFNIEVNERIILCTFHPETIGHENNANHAHEIVESIRSLDDYRVVITMPNADTSGNVIRQIFQNAFQDSQQVKLVENLGTQGYLSAMKLCSMMLGNSSSGIIEAASLGKYVIDLGERQNGRAHGENVIHCEIRKDSILRAIKSIASRPELSGNNIYYQGGAASQIIERIESILC